MARKSIRPEVALSGFSIESIHEYFRSPPPIYLNKEQAVCYIFSVLLDRDSYGTELMDQLGKKFPNCQLSDTVLYSALNFLEEEAIALPYWKKVEGRGRPRRMWHLTTEWRKEAQTLANFWSTQNQPKDY